MTDQLSSPAHGVCALCGGALNPATQACTRCGKKAETIGRCSQCQAIASVEPNKDLAWVCSVCGGARLLPSDLEDSRDTGNALRVATRAHRLSKLLQPFAYGAAALAVFGWLIALVATNALNTSDATSGAIYALPGLMVLLAGLGFWKARSFRTGRNARLDEAYKHAMLEWIASRSSGTTSSDIAKHFGIDTRRSELLLAALNVRDDVTSRVTEDGQIAYAALASPNQGPETLPLTERLRVPETPDSSVNANASGDDSEVKTLISSGSEP